MATVKTVAVPFVNDSITSRLRYGVLLCDPKRLDEFFGGDAKGRDLSYEFFTSESKNVATEGIVVPFFGQEREQCKVTVRGGESDSGLRHPSSVSDGWILGTDTGQLVLCSADALLFWDPYESDEDPRRYVSFSVPPGWYQVTIRFERRTEDGADDDDQWADIIEFVITPSPTRPTFTAALFPSNEPITTSWREPETPTPDAVHAPVDTTLAKAVLPQLTASAFEMFVSKLFSSKHNEYEPDVYAVNVDEGAFYQPLIDSYGSSLHSVFLLHYLPLGLFRRPQIDQIANDPTLPGRLERVKSIYNGKAGYFGMVSPELVKATVLRSVGFLLNLGGVAKHEYDSKIIPQYSELVRNIGLHAPITVVGSYDSFLDFSASAVQAILSEFLTNRIDGFAIQISPSGPQIQQFSSQTSFETGVLESNNCPYEPIIIAASKRKADLLFEFEYLLAKDSPEQQLETFLVAHAKDIFGGQYDRIEPQIWLRFPELDIAGKERRMDLFMRNSISNDWELFEIKRPISLIRNYRDGPAFVAEVAHAMTQLKRYARLLSSSSVKETLKRSGIEYFEPTLSLVIGRRPGISPERWRWLLTTQNNDIRLLTFDDLVAEMAARLADSLRFINQLREHP